MKVRQALAARLIAPLHDEREAETRPLEEIEEDLRCLGIDPSSSIAKAQRLTFEQLSPTASLDGLEHVSGRHDPAPTRPARGSKDWLSPTTVVGLLRLSDVAVVLSAAWFAWITRFDGVEPVIEPYLAVLAVILTLNVFQFADLYRFDQLTNLFSQLRQLLLAWATVIAGLLVIGFMLKVTSLTLPLNFERSVIHATSRIWVGLWFLYGLFGLFLVRLLFSWQISRWQAAGRLTRRIIVLGAGDHGQQLIEQILRDGKDSVRIVGLFDDRQASRVPGKIRGVPVFGKVADAATFVRGHPIDQVVVALPWHAGSRILAWLQAVRGLPVEICLCPGATGPYLPQGHVVQLAGVPMLNLREKPLSGWSCIVKRTEDRMLAAAILLVLLPVLLLIGALIKLESRGPVLVRQKRHDVNGQLVELHMFRTTYIAEGGIQTCSESGGGRARPTAFGHILRQSSLDQLPQFFDILMGTRSSSDRLPHETARS